MVHEISYESLTVNYPPDSPVLPFCDWGYGEALRRFVDEWNAPQATVLVHTSGSTGKPKPMLAEKQRMINSATITCRFLGLLPGSTALLCMPLDYIAGKMVVVRSMACQLKLWVEKPSGHPLKDLPLAPDFAAMIPLQVYNSLQDTAERALLRQIKHLIIGGGAIDEALERQLADFPNAVWSTYGMTETLSHIALRRLSGDERSQWYRPFDTVNVSLNADGCLCIDAPLVHNGTLQTHDIAKINTKGEFCILGRMDNIIDTGGIKVQTEQVEKLLHQHLQGDFIITHVPHVKFGEAITLLYTDNDSEKVKTICRQYLPRYWQPLYYIRVPQLPFTATGKPARGRAASMAAELVSNTRE